MGEMTILFFAVWRWTDFMAVAFKVRASSIGPVMIVNTSFPFMGF